MWATVGRSRPSIAANCSGFSLSALRKLRRMPLMNCLRSSCAWKILRKLALGCHRHVVDKHGQQEAEPLGFTAPSVSLSILSTGRPFSNPWGCWDVPETECCWHRDSARRVRGELPRSDGGSQGRQAAPGIKASGYKNGLCSLGFAVQVSVRGLGLLRCPFPGSNRFASGDLKLETPQSPNLNPTSPALHVEAEYNQGLHQGSASPEWCASGPQRDHEGP